MEVQIYIWIKKLRLFSVKYFNMTMIFLLVLWSAAVINTINDGNRNNLL